MTGETVLMYNCSGPEWAKLRQIFLMLRVRIRQVAPEQYGLTLEELLSRSEESRPVEESFLEPMLVFCGSGPSGSDPDHDEPRRPAPDRPEGDAHPHQQKLELPAALD